MRAIEQRRNLNFRQEHHLRVLNFHCKQTRADTILRKEEALRVSDSIHRIAKTLNHSTMPSRTSASPSPPPQVPVAATPGLRAAALHKIFTNALTSTLKANSYSNFSACFPTPAQHCPSALEGVWKQLNTKLEEGCTREFETILQERNVVEGLNEWDSRIDDARRRLNRGVDGEQPGRP